MEPIILVIKGGTLRLAEKEEFKKANGEDVEIRQYCLSTVDNMYKVVDLDKSEVKPIIRSILGQIGLYPELGIVKSTRWIVSILVVLCLFILMTASGANTEKSFKEGQKTIIETIKKSCLTSSPIENFEVKGVEKPDDKNFKIFGK